MYSWNKILYFFVACVCLLAIPCKAIKIGKGIVRIDDENFGLFQKDIPLNLTDTRISFGFTLNDGNSEDEFLTPAQVSIGLSADNINSEFYVYPKLIQEKVYEANIPVSEISTYLLSQEMIRISVITGDPSDASLNSIIKVGSIIPSDKLKADKSIDLPTRFGVKDEIHHIFRSDPKSLPVFISSQFVFLLIICLGVLLLAWSYFDAVNVNNIGKFSPVVYLFITTIFAFEYLFFDYYLGTSIFASLERFAITGIFAIYFGSKVLKNMYKLRTENFR